jgi:hemerythrin-like domain-containing protein
VAQKDAPTQVLFSQAEQTDMGEFVAIYKDHIRSEEDLVFPEARRVLNPEQIEAISKEMMRRRVEK